jgi:hypothetical protein
MGAYYPELIKGAYNVTRYSEQMKARDKASMELQNTLNETVNDIAERKKAAKEQAELEWQQREEGIKAERQAKQKAWDKNTYDKANSILGDNGELSTNNHRQLRSVLEEHPQMQQLFLNGDKGQQAEALNNVQRLNNQVNGFKAQRKTNAALWSKQNLSDGAFDPAGYSLGLQDDEEARAMLGNHNGDDALGVIEVLDKDGNMVGVEAGFKNEDGTMMSINDAQQLSSKFQVDAASAKGIMELKEISAKEAKKGNHQSVFNADETKNAVRRLVKNGKQISLMHDPLVRQKSFKDDLLNSGYLSAISYESLGIDPPAGDDNNMVDLKGDGLSEDDQRSIINAFIKDPNMKSERDELLVDYYTQFVKQGWDKQHKVHVDVYNQNNPPQMSPTLSEVELQRLAETAWKGKQEEKQMNPNQDWAQ